MKPRYKAAKGLYPRRGVVLPDKSWHVYALAVFLLLFNLFAVVEWATAEPFRYSGPIWEEVGSDLPWGTVLAHKVNARTGPGLEYEVRYQPFYGHCVEILGADGDWYAVRDYYYLDEILWIHSDYLKITHWQ